MDVSVTFNTFGENRHKDTKSFKDFNPFEGVDGVVTREIFYHGKYLSLTFADELKPAVEKIVKDNDLLWQLSLKVTLEEPSYSQFLK